MGDKKGKVLLKLSTGAVGDRMDVRFGGRYILSTCGSLLRPSQYPKCSSPAECFPTTGAYQFRDYTFDYDPAVSKFVEVYTLGFLWSAPKTVGSSAWDARSRVGVPFHQNPIRAFPIFYQAGIPKGKIGKCGKKRKTRLERRVLVPRTGFEPAHPFGRYHLKVVRLPVSPPGL
jgi:hypothetical protein